MARRDLLHRNKLDYFKAWLVANGYQVLDPKGDYEVLRWKPTGGGPMPIVFDRHGGDHLAINNAATPYVNRCLRQRGSFTLGEMRDAYNKATSGEQLTPGERELADARAHAARMSMTPFEHEREDPPTSNDMSSPLPCDVKVRHITFKKGTTLRTLVNAADRWLGMAIDKGYNGEEPQ